MDTATAAASIESALAQARRRWPGIDPPEDLVAAFVARQLPARATNATVDALALVDVVLAVACLASDRHATAAFIAEMGREVDYVRGRAGVRDVSVEDVRQRVFERLLVSRPDGPPRLAGYRGDGPLRRWVSMAASRVVVDLQRKAASAGAAAATSASLPEVVAAMPEVAVLRRSLLPAFRRALRSVLSELEPIERTLLRLRYAQGVSVTDLASMHGTHRVTMSRRLTELRRLVGERVQACVAQAQTIAPAELAEVVPHLRSQLDLSLSVLGPADEDSP